MPSEQNTGQNQIIETVNESSKNVRKLKYLEMTLANQNCMRGVIKRRLYSGNACYHLVPHPFSLQFLSENIKIKYTEL